MKKYKKDYNHQSLRDEREYGLYWYSGLWQILRPILVVAGSLILVAGLLMTGWNWAYGHFLAPMDVKDANPMKFVVESGNSLTKVADNLESQGLVRNPTIFKYYCDFIGLGQKIQAGEYTLTRAMTIDQIANQLTTGDGKPITTTITVIPGWNVEDIAQKLASTGVIPSKDEFLSLCKSGKDFTDYSYIADVLATPNVGQRKYVLEGYLSPNTYEVYTDASAGDIIRKLLSQTEAAFPSEYYDRADELGMTMDQVMTMASLIEKEAKTADFAKVSAVFHNRIKQKIKLGSDVTIHYITGVRRLVLRKQDMNIDSLYNTYKYSGLPLGPICSPSPAAIMAALYPDEAYVADNYLYFCATDPNTGVLKFSKTLQEHNQAVSIYSPLWEAFDESQGLTP